ncbi:hypothetical protein ACH40E_42550 [Streptomyces acidicola]|uniref:hypothetical protein n=1 Tax=Streptomyces acidicola TaxID=2596892 RepID=UPI0037AD93A4
MTAWCRTPATVPGRTTGGCCSPGHRRLPHRSPGRQRSFWAPSPRLAPAQVAEALVATATGVTVGHGHPRFGNPAGPGFDAATGPGLINVSAALVYAREQF